MHGPTRIRGGIERGHACASRHRSESGGASVRALGDTGRPLRRPVRENPVARPPRSTRPASASRVSYARRRGRRRAALLFATSLLLVAHGAPGAGPDGRFERRSSASFVLYQDVGIDHRTGWRGSEQFEREVLASLESAHDGLRALLGVEPRTRIVVTIYDPAVFDAAFGRLAAFPSAGFFAGSIRIRGDLRLTPELARVLHHEYVHAALAAAAPSLVLPALLNEGLAEWFSRYGLGAPAIVPAEVSALAAALHAGTWIPFDALLSESFAHLGPREAALAYLESKALVAHLVHRRGEQGLRQLWRSLLRSGDLERAIVRVFGSHLAQIEAVLRSELSR